MSNNVTLQINLSPSDYAHAKWILPHQLKALANQVEFINLIIDGAKVEGKSRAESKKELSQIRDLAQSQKEKYPHLSLLEVDYSAKMARKIKRTFTKATIPHRDYQGNSVYAQLFSIQMATTKYIFHLGSEMMLGGGSQTWVEEALTLIRMNRKISLCCPLPGPKPKDNRLRFQPSKRFSGPTKLGLSFRFSNLSSRIFLVERARSIGLIKKSKFQKSESTDHVEMLETSLSRTFSQSALVRVDFLGKKPGLWSLSPPEIRTSVFYKNLPKIIRKVEEGNLPMSQGGFYNLRYRTLDTIDGDRSRS